MILCGIDPGYDRLGWVVGEAGTGGSVTVLEYGCITTSSKDPIFERYQVIVQALESVLTKFAPEELAIESVFFSNNQKTALRVSEVRGLIIGSFLLHNSQVFEYNPMQIKLAVTGSGAADKTAVTKMVKLQLKLQAHAKPELDDTMDALAILLTHATVRKIQKVV